MIRTVRSELIRIWRPSFRYGGIGLVAATGAHISIFTSASDPAEATQAEPNRVKLLGGKVVALTGFAVLATAVTTFTIVFVSRPLARLEGIDTEPWKTDFLAELGSGYLHFLIPSVVWGLIGLFIAVWTRSSGIAIAAGTGYLLVVESLLGIMIDDVTD